MSQFDGRIGHGESPPFLGSDAVEDRVDHLSQDDQDDDRDDRGQVKRPERRQQATKHPQVWLANVAEEVLDSAKPGRVREPDPGAEDIDEDEEDVDEDQNVDEPLRRRGGIEEQDGLRASAHTARSGSGAALPTLYAWLKKPPVSSRRARA